MRKSIRDRLTLCWLPVPMIFFWLLLFEENWTQSFFFWQMYTVLIMLNVMNTVKLFVFTPYELTHETPVSTVTQVYDEPVTYTVLVDLSRADTELVKARIKVFALMRHLCDTDHTSTVYMLDKPECTYVCRNNPMSATEVDELFGKDMPPIPDGVLIRVECSIEGSYPMSFDEWQVRIPTPVFKNRDNEHSLPQGRSKANG